MRTLSLFVPKGGKEKLEEQLNINFQDLNDDSGENAVEIFTDNNRHDQIQLITADEELFGLIYDHVCDVVEHAHDMDLAGRSAVTSEGGYLESEEEFLVWKGNLSIQDCQGDCYPMLANKTGRFSTKGMQFLWEHVKQRERVCSALGIPERELFNC